MDGGAEIGRVTHLLLALGLHRLGVLLQRAGGAIVEAGLDGLLDLPVHELRLVDDAEEGGDGGQEPQLAGVC